MLGTSLLSTLKSPPIQKYELRTGPLVERPETTSWTFSCGGTPANITNNSVCSWQKHANSNLLGTGLACTGRYTTLQDAKRACEALVASVGCFGITMDNGAVCLGDSGNNTAGAGCHTGRGRVVACLGINEPRRFRVAVALHGLLRQPCVVHMLLAAIDPRDDLFLQVNYWRYPENARTGDYGKRRVSAKGFLPLFDRAVAFTIHDQTTSDRDRPNVDVFRRALTRGDPYTASIKNQTLKNACRALVLLDHLASSIEAYESENKIRYDIVVSTRVDVLPLRPFVTQLPILATRVISPSADRWSGLNDRMMAGKRDDVLTLMRRVHLLKQYFATSNKKQLLVEPFLAWCAARSRISVILASSPFGAIRRVRTRGFIEREMQPVSASCPMDLMGHCNELHGLNLNETALSACGFPIDTYQRTTGFW